MAKNNPYTLLDARQTTTQAFDEINDAHRVEPLVGGIPIGPNNPFPVSGSLPFAYDYVSMALSNGDARETYTFKTGGSGGVTTGTVVINYTDSSREVLVDATITPV